MGQPDPKDPMGSDQTRGKELLQLDSGTGLAFLFLYFFNWTHEQDNVDSLVEAFNVNKATLLRSFCQKTGVQILLREYQVL